MHSIELHMYTLLNTMRADTTLGRGRVPPNTAVTHGIWNCTGPDDKTCHLGDNEMIFSHRDKKQREREHTTVFDIQLDWTSCAHTHKINWPQDREAYSGFEYTDD